MNEIILEAKNLYKIYREETSKGTPVETVALRGIDFTVRNGDFSVLIGPSGSGKSTLINLFGALDSPTAGTITYYFDREYRVHQMSESERDHFRAGKISVIFQRENLVRSLTAKENAELSLKFLGVPKSIRERRIMEVFGNLGMKNRLGHRPDELSGGEKQRVSLACALAYSPNLILADEPTGELDYETTRDVLAAFKEANESNGTAMIVVTHNPMVARAGKTHYEVHDGLIRETTGKVYADRIFVNTDSYSRIALPYSWLQRLEIKDEIVKIQSIEEGGLKLVALAEDSRPEMFSQVDRHGRLLLPKNFVEIKNWAAQWRDKAIWLTPVKENKPK
ncbi:MAG TPA: ABC transporter ATP-binding protein [Candidatus Hodarchaeales archaeon]|nr:ABC transporter ATP-binding protein [Candidatus Hodarchaeales archaeon]